MLSNSCKSFITSLPKAELHVHLEGTLEPELYLLFAQRNKIDTPFSTAQQARDVYAFTDYASFINTFIQLTSVIRTQQDFYDMAIAYLKKAHSQGVVHAEIFFDFQTYTPRAIGPEPIINGLHEAITDSNKQLGMSASLIMCIIRHLPEADALVALQQALPFKDKIVGIGLASLEDGNPPSKFQRVFAAAKAQGFRLTAHAAEDSDGENVRQALQLLQAERIDHGVGCVNNLPVVQELVARKIPLTVCPFSNVALGIFKRLEDHPIKKMLQAGLQVSINSDDPAFFGGYITDNYIATADAVGLTCQDLIACARNSFTGSFLNAERKQNYLAMLEEYVRGHECE